MQFRALAYFAVCVLCLTGCSEPPTQVLVHFDVDEGLSVDAAGSMRVEVNDADTSIYVESRDTSTFTFPTTIPIVRRDEGTTAEFQLTAELRDGSGAVASVVRARGRFVEGETRALWLRFYALCDPPCTGEETCFRDACVDGCFLPTSEGDGAESEPIDCEDVSPMDGGSDVDAAGVDGGAATDAATASDASTCDCTCSNDICVDGICRTPAEAGVVQVSAGNTHTCAIRGDGSVWCWGVNDKGQLGDNTVDDRRLPVPVVPYGEMGPAANVAVSQARYTCAATTDGELWCWGESEPAAGGPHRYYPPDTTGIFGATVPQPVNTEETDTVLTLFAGRRHTCARVISAATGRTRCMGTNDYQQLGREATVTSFGSLQRISNIGDAVTRASAGHDHNCVIHQSLVKCWGRNSSGQAGIGTTDAIAYPPSATSDVGITSWLEVGLGWNHSCAISDTEVLYCWGAGGEGRLGTGDTANLTRPTEIDAGPGWTMVDGGTTHTCGIRDGALLCWGSNGAGELGDGTRIPRHIPTVIGDETNWTSVAAGNTFTCGVRGEDRLYCWGNNEFGQIGIGPEPTALVPTRICFP